MDDFSALLREAGFRATPGRVSLLKTLAKEPKPLTVLEILEKLGKTRMNEVTLYRALEVLAEKGIVDRTELGHGHAHFELAVGKRHHHHVVCTSCERVEDIADRNLEAALEKAIRKSSFEKITNHSVELFGLCATCA